MIRNLISLIFLGIFCFSAYAQENIQDLEKKLKKANGKEKFEVLYKLAKANLKNSPNKSVEYGKRAADEATKLNQPNLKANSFGIMGTAYYNQKNYKNALKYYQEELLIREKLKQENSRIRTLSNIGSIYEASEKYPKAIESYNLALDALKKRNDDKLTYQCFESKIRIYFIEKDFKSAYETLRAYMNFKSKNTSEIDNQKIEILETQITEEKKANIENKEALKQKDSAISLVKTEKEILVKDTIVKSKAIKEKNLTIAEQKEEVRRIWQWIWAFIVFIGVIAVFSILLYRQYRAKKKAFEKLSIQNAEIIEQKEEIHAQAEQLVISNVRLTEQHQEILEQKMQITDSIRYASRIQGVMLPKDDFLDEVFTENMVLWRPQELVSGDFYWVKKIKNFVIFAAADCTGHGVPGAFMSMLGISYLNEIVSKSRFDKSNEILNLMRRRIKKALNQTGKVNEAADGMDIALCILDTENNILQYSGAYNPLFLIRDGDLQIIKADKQPIAIYPREKDFTYNEIEVKKGDVLYIFSDGYMDQFGGEKNEKLKSTRFKQILVEIHPLPMKEQKTMLNQFMDSWLGSNGQIDDILVFGIRI